MDILRKKYFFSETEKCAFFEKIFKELKIAPVDSDHVAEIKLNECLWYRKNIPFLFSNFHCTAYKFGKYMIVWKGCSDEPIFLMEYEHPYEVFSIEKFDFFIRKKLSDGGFCVERYTWEPSGKNYVMERYANNTIPTDFSSKEDKTIRNKPEWLRVYPHKNIETKSVDNTIFYDYIVKFWQM